MVGQGEVACDPSINEIMYLEYEVHLCAPEPLPGPGRPQRTPPGAETRVNLHSSMYLDYLPLAVPTCCSLFSSPAVKSMGTSRKKMCHLPPSSPDTKLLPFGPSPSTFGHRKQDQPWPSIPRRGRYPHVHSVNS